jgi:DNA repair ATPase RecN
VKTITEESHQSVSKVIELVTSSFDPDDVYWSLEYDRTVEALRIAAVIREKLVLINDPNNLASQTIIQEAHNLADAKERRLATISSSIIEVCEKLRKAEKELTNVMKYKDFPIEEIDRYVDTIEEFIKLYKILSND